jgi:hypothetical protein
VPAHFPAGLTREKRECYRKGFASPAFSGLFRHVHFVRYASICPDIAEDFA